MRRHDRILWLIRVTVALSLSSDGFAADLVKLPPINLGTTAFRDGVAGPGTLLQINSGFSRADSFKSGNGNSLPGDNRIDVNAYLLQLAHITKNRLFGGFYGAEVLVPYSNINPDTSLRGLPKQSESGVGDVLLSPFMLQWVRIGLAGYYLNQLSEDKIDGVKQRDSKERVAAFGPGLRYGSNSGFLNLNGFYEFGAENRTQGYRVVLRYAWFFK